MRILLTGANGFVGSHVLDALVRTGHEALVLLRETSDPRRIARLLPKVRVSRGRLEDPASLADACAEAEAVIHCAGLTRALRAAAFMEANAAGTDRLVGAANRAPGVRRFLLVSSLAAAGPGTPEHPARESDPPRPVSAYGRSKRAGEEAVRASARMPWTILRPPLVYGPGDPELRRVFRWAARGRLPLPHTGGQPLSVVYAADLADALLACLEPPACHGKTYHAAHPDWTTAAALAGAIAAAVGRADRRRVRIPRLLLPPLCAAAHAAGLLTGRPGVINLFKRPELTAPGWVCDTALLARDAGFRAATDLAEGLRRTAAAYRAEGSLPAANASGLPAERTNDA